MAKKILLGVTIILICVLLAGWYFFTREAKYFGTSAFKAVPENVSVIVRIHHSGSYAKRSLNNPIWKAYSGFPGITTLYEQLVFADSLFKVYPEAKNSFSDKDLTIVFGGEDDHFWNLFLIELSSLAEKRALSGMVENFFSLKGAATENVKSGGADLTCYLWNEGELQKSYCIAFYRGIFLAGADRRMIAQALEKLENPDTQPNSVFAKANKTATENIDLNIYLNHKTLPQYANRLFSESFLKKLKGSAPLAEWSEIDLTQKNDELLFNGFSFMSDSLDQYLGIFLHQKPGSFNLAEVFPAETSFFLSYVISNNQQLFRDYEDLLADNNQLKQYKNSLNEIDTLYGVNIQKIIVDNLDGAAAMVFTQPDPVLSDENKYLVIRVGSGIKMENDMFPLTKMAGSKGTRDLPGSFSLYRIDKETVFKIYKMPVNNFGKRVFGEVFSEVVTNYFTIYDNCLIMGASFESLCEFLRANVLKETLGNDQTFRAFTSGLSNRLNFYLWNSPGRSLPFFRETINAGLYQSIEKQITEFKQIESVGWQFGIENGMVYNLARLKYNPEIRESSQSVIWKSHLGNVVINQPQYVINPSDRANREIVVQDQNFNFSLISNQGRVLWKIKLQGPILSTVFQLDFFRDGKLHYFFNTEEALHLIDHNGNYVQNYPLALRSPATNGVSVVDYDANKDYRFFIAGKDHQVYLYDKKGKIVTGWNPPKTEHDVNQPVQFFRVYNKDYIVFTDKNRGYILDRKGKTRITIKGDIAYSGNGFTLDMGFGNWSAQLVTTDSKGDIVSIRFDGSVKRLSTRTFSPDHYFVHDYFDPDKKRDYIFLDGDSLVVYNQAAEQIFSRKFNHKINLPPYIFTFPDRSRKIGITDSAENRIYLFNVDGTVYKGFPLDGNSRFALGITGTQNGQFNLITGTSDGYLNNYLIK